MRFLSHVDGFKITDVQANNPAGEELIRYLIRADKCKELFCINLMEKWRQKGVQLV
jgi:hypothetical protein